MLGHPEGENHDTATVNHFSSQRSDGSEHGPRMAVAWDSEFSDFERSERSTTDDRDIFTSFAALESPEPSIAQVAGVTLASKMLGGTLGGSEVWQCEYEGFAEKVAVKVLAERPDGAVANEASILKSVAHPHLVQLLHVVEGPKCALVLELCKGGSLSAFAHTTKGQALTCFTLEKRLKPVFEVSHAIAYLHSMDIMHRDIKPSNVFFHYELVWQNQMGLPPVKVVDFGSACLVTSAAQMTACIGTVVYMAPENFTGHSYGKPADVFSIAMLANELATCEQPFIEHFESKANRNIAAIGLLIAQGHRPHLCDSLLAQEFISPCWSGDPNERWPATLIAQYLLERLQVV